MTCNATVGLETGYVGQILYNTSYIEVFVGPKNEPSTESIQTLVSTLLLIDAN